jgi:fatty-acyl-CoA synthase
MTMDSTVPTSGSAGARAYRTELSPLSFLRRSAYVFPDKVAVVHGERRTTYREFDERVNRLASALASAGVDRGDRVAFVAPNIPATLEAHYGVPAAGAVLVSVNTRLSREEVVHIIQHSGARMVFVDREFAHLVGGAGLPTVRIDDTGKPGDPYDDFLAGGSLEQFEIPVLDEEDTISINYTSGTTGQPKGVMYTHRGAYLNALVEALQANLRPESVQLWVVPMFHCNGWCFTWAVTAMGGRHVCMRKVDPGEMWELFDREGVTHYGAAPTVQLAIATHPAAHRLERGLTVTTGGASSTPSFATRPCSSAQWSRCLTRSGASAPRHSSRSRPDPTRPSRRSSTSAANTSPATKRQLRSSSASSRRPRPARCRSTFSASRSGAAATSASTSERPGYR